VLVAVASFYGRYTVCAVSGASMEPTYLDGDRLLIERGLGEVQRGDVLVIRNPLASQELLVKRVVGLPGEALHGSGEQLFVNGAPLREPYAKSGTGVGDLLPSQVPAGHYYMVGDNRTESIDSRQFDAVGRDLVVGKVVSHLWPPR
jgi:signal peptidase I